MLTLALGQFIMSRMDDIRAQFTPGVRVTVVIRSPDLPDGSQDIIVTADDLGDVIAALNIRRQREGATKAHKSMPASQAVA